MLQITNVFAQSKEADNWFKNGHYSKALESYQQVSKPDNETMLKMAISHYETNNLEEALKYLNFLSNSTEPEVFLYLGKVYQAQLNFNKAINNYKQFLRYSKSNAPLRRSVVDEIKRCAYGNKLQKADKKGVVENLGEKVNTVYDEIFPVPSPTNEDKIYFASAREETEGGMRDSKGFKDEFGHYCTDIFSTEIIDGEWKETQGMPGLINSARHDIIMDFDKKGKVMYYFRGFNTYSGDIFLDTFRVNPNDSPLSPTPFVSPINSKEADGTIYLFNDSILLFSSMRKGGFGGFDLYFTKFSEGKWSDPQNLGKEVNSPYDEKFPFLALDGRTLYFSSNRLQGAGGFDIFTSTFNDRNYKWSNPSNIGLPINSAGDENAFRLSKDGFKGFLSSERKDGFGGFDIYQVLFKQRNEEQNRLSRPICFTEVPKPDSAMLAEVKNEPEIKPVEESVFYSFLPFYYDNDDDVLSIGNTRQLNRLAKLLNRNPSAKVELSCHGDDNDPIEFRHYFCIKRVEKLSEYLLQNGVQKSQLILKSYGDNYPIAQNNINGLVNASAQKMNRRIDLKFFNTEGLPLKIDIEFPDVNSTMQDDSYTNFNKKVASLTYKIQLAALRQMYKSAAFVQDDAMIEKEMDKNLYLYTVGLLKTFDEAKKMQQSFTKNGLSDTRIIPYIDGVRIDEETAKLKRTQFKDLANYLKK